MSSHSIHHQDYDHRGMAYLGEEQSPQAAMTYTLATEKLLIIDHTEVGESLRGQGIGRQLLQVIVNLARERNQKIVPLCPYARAAFQKDESIRDVLRG